MASPGSRSTRESASTVRGDFGGNGAGSHASREQPAHTQPAHSPRWLHWVTRISIVIGIGALVVTIWLVGPHVLLAQLANIGWFFAALVGLELATSMCDATAVYYMADGTGRPSWRACVVAQITGRGINSVTPGGNLGEALKVSLLAHHCPPRRIVAAVMYVNLVAVVINLGIVAVASAATAFLFDLPHAAMVALVVGGAVAAGVAIAIMYLIKRGMLSTLANALHHLHIISKKRRERWKDLLDEVDRRLRGQDGSHARKAVTYIAISQLAQKATTYATVMAAGYMLSPGQFLALCSAGVLLGWISAIIPLGLGVAEGGNVALFSLIGAPTSLGLALALARRANQIVFAAIGFVVLSADRAVTRVHTRVSSRFPVPT